MVETFSEILLSRFTPVLLINQLDIVICPLQCASTSKEFACPHIVDATNAVDTA